MQRVILHCDMNNFYASVECMLNPELKNKPVAVCGSVEERHGIVLAKNYAAKAFGVSTGEAIWQAKQKCQDLVIVEPHYEQYMKFSKLAREIYGRYTDQIEPYGTAAVNSFCLLMRRLHGFAVEGKVRKYDTAILGAMVKIAIPSILQQSIVSIGMLLVQSVVNGFGSSVLAGYAAATRIESICIVPMISTGNAVSTFTAQNMGAGKPERVRKGYRAACAIAGGFALLICLILLFFDRQIIGTFMDTSSGAVAYATGTGYLSFIKFFFICIGLKAVTDGVLRGAGDVVVFTLANLVNLGIRVSGAFLLSPVLGVAAVWYAIPAGWTVNYLISLCRYLTGKWSKKNLIV